MSPHNPAGVYGRLALVAALSGNTDRVLLLTGDSGVGKTTVLMAARAGQLDLVAPEPISLRHSPGALKDGVLQSLAIALTSIRDDERVLERLDRVTRDTVARITEAGPKALAKVVAREFAAIVRARLGAKVGEATRDFFRELDNTDDPDLGSRIAAARDPDVAEVLCRLIEGVGLVSGDMRVVVSLDRGELADDFDRRLLADIAERLKDPHQLRIAVSTSDALAHAELEHLVRMDGVGQIEVTGLSKDAIALWMVDRGHDPSLADSILRLTGGYGLFVEDALAGLSAGDEVGVVEPSTQLEGATNRAWEGIDLTTRALVRKLAVLAEPLLQDEVLEFLDVDLMTWAEIERTLVSRRIFGATVNGRPWFHELRRRYIEDHIISQEERASGASQALPIVFRSVNENGDTTRIAEVARLAEIAALSSDLLSEVKVVTHLDRDELRLVGALIELSDSKAEARGAVLADQLLPYARELYPGAGDLASAYARLAARSELVVSAADERAAVLVPKFAGMALVVAMGRVAIHHMKLPLPGYVSTFMRLAIYDRLGLFEAASYGSGHPEVATILASLQRPIRRSDGVLASRDYKADPAIVARFRVGGRHIYLGARYREASDRDAALDSLDDVPWRLLDESIETEMTSAQPQGRIACLTYANACQLIDGVQLEVSYGGRVEPSDAGTFDVETYGPIKQAIFEELRDLTSDDDRLALGLVEEISVLTLGLDDGRLECLVRGRVGGARVIPEGFVGFRSDPFWSYKAAESLGLGTDQRLSHMSSSRGQFARHDPVADAIALIVAWGQDFNRTQPRIQMTYRPDVLEGAILATRTREWKTASRLVVPLRTLRRDVSLRPARRLEITLGRPVDYGPRSYFGPSLHWLEFESPTGDEEVLVQWLPEDGIACDPFEERRHAPGLIASGTSVAVDSSIAHWLGFTHDDINLVGHILFPWSAGETDPP